ncbi:MAG: hypothetical protein V8R51_06675 [Clostridia bacterium]
MQRLENESVKILGGKKMAGAIMDKVWGLFGGVDQGEAEEYDDDDVYEYEDKSSNYENEEEDKIFGRKKEKLYH